MTTPLLDQETPTARALRSLVVLMLVALLAFVSHNLWASKLDTARFVADSVARDSDHQLLLQMNRRISDIWCVQMPPQQQKACR